MWQLTMLYWPQVFKRNYLVLLSMLNLNFKTTSHAFVTKARQKIHVLSRIKSYLSLNKRRLLMKTFVKSQSNCCPVISMFHSKPLNHKTNNVHEKALRIAYSDYRSPFQELLDKDTPFSVHHRNIRTLAIELFKHIHELSPAIMGDVCKINTTLLYNIRTHNRFYSRNPRTVKYGEGRIYF